MKEIKRLSANKEITLRWKHTKKIIVMRDFYKCKHCNKDLKEHWFRKNGVATVDHIMPLLCGGEMFDLENLQTLCSHCHRDKTTKDIKKIKQLRDSGLLIKDWRCHILFENLAEREKWEAVYK